VADVAHAVLAGHLGLDVRLAHRGRRALGELAHRVAVAAAHVEHLAHRPGRVERGQAGAGHVGHVHEVALLQAVLEHQRRPVVEQPRREDGQHAGVRVGERLARAEHVEEAQRHGGDPVRGADHQAQPLLVVLAERVHAGERRPLGLGRGERLEHAAAPVARLPVAGDELLARPLGVAHERAVGRPVEPLAVERHARRHHEARERAPLRPLGHRLEQHRGAHVVDARVAGDLVHALADPHRRGEVVDRVDAVERPVHRAAVAHVAHHQLDLGIEVLGAAPVGGRVAVHLLRERVERPHAMAVSQEQVGEVRADEARAAGDQDGLPHGAW
jgi:hypothetical protein